MKLQKQITNQKELHANTNTMSLQKK